MSIPTDFNEQLSLFESLKANDKLMKLAYEVERSYNDYMNGIYFEKEQLQVQGKTYALGSEPKEYTFEAYIRRLGELNPESIEKLETLIIYETLKADDTLRDISWQRERATIEYNSQIASAREEGMKIGLELARKKGARNIALKIATNLLDVFTDNETIADVTGLTLEEIEKLRQTAIG